jgi:hypothetical protein
MIPSRPLFRRTFEAPCSVEIEHSPESLHAHVELDGDVAIEPGDQVLVHDAPTDVPYGQTLVVRRTTTIIRAGLIERIWTRIAGNFELTELYDVSFSERRRL